MNLKLVAELLEGLSDELRAIVMDDELRDAEAVNDIVFGELNHVLDFDLFEGDGFCRFGEVIGYHQDEPMSFG